MKRTKSEEKDKKKAGKKAPNVDFRLTFADMVTSLNLVAGVFAIDAALLGKHEMALALVAAAMVFDLFDGKIARFLKQDHALGRELDSLSDLVSFGVAPGIILLVQYQLDWYVLAGCAVFAVAGAYRLARFNLLAQAGVTGEFLGVPIPAAAFLLLACSFLPLAAWAIAAIAIVLAALMASTLRIKKIL